MKRTSVVNSKQESFNVYIGRPSEFGNPFSMKYHKDKKKTEATRPNVIRKFALHIQERFENEPGLLEKWREQLQGQVLGCFCEPLACHGHVIAALIDGLEWNAYLPEGWDAQDPQASLF